MLTVIVVIGIIAAIAVPMLAGISRKAEIGTAKRNAQNLASIYQSAAAAGAVFSSTTKFGISNELIAGIRGDAVNGALFQAHMTDSARDAALFFLSYDPGEGPLLYDPDANAGSGEWTEWTHLGMTYTMESEARDEVTRLAGEFPENNYEARHVVEFVDNDAGGFLYDAYEVWCRAPL